MESSRETHETIQDLGHRIVKCTEKCEGVENAQHNGYYPRLFFFEPQNISKVELVIVGENPGNSSFLEREFYKALAERNEDDRATFRDCLRVWSSIAEEHDYYQRPKHLLKELGLNSMGTLWAEVVFCEKSPTARRIPRKTYEKCSNRFLKEIVRLVPDGKYLFCLGNTAFQHVRKLPRSIGKKIISVYHPTGSRVFANYFEKEKRKKITERKLKKRILDDFKRLEENHTSYEWIVRP